MDINFLMMNQVSGLPLDNAFGNAPVEDGFGDLLGLVESLETAEMSSVVDQDVLWSELAGEMKDSSELALNMERDMALNTLQLNTGILQKSFGQATSTNKVAMPESLPEVKATNFSELQTQTPSLESFQQGVPKSFSLGENPVSHESVAAWTAALSSGEVANIEVGDELSKPQMVSDKVEVSRLQNPVVTLVESQGSGFESGDQKDASTSKQSFGVESLETKSVELERSRSYQNSEELIPVEASKTATKTQVADAGRIHKDPSASVQKHVGAESLPEDSKLTPSTRANSFELDPQVKKLTDAKAKPQSQSARDFMLDRTAVGLSSQGVTQEANALGGKLSEKIDAKVIDFVADKVQQLQATGGGTLKVGLETKSEGSLEIKVTLRGGQVDVRIEGSDVALTRELNHHKSELMSRLEKTVDVASLDIGSRKTVDSSHVRMGAMDRATALLSSDEMVRSLTGAEFAKSSDESLGVQRSNASLSVHASDKGAASSDNTQEFSREDRREQAMNQWADFYQKMKKSA